MRKAGLGMVALGIAAALVSGYCLAIPAWTLEREETFAEESLETLVPQGEEDFDTQEETEETKADFAHSEREEVEFPVGLEPEETAEVAPAPEGSPAVDNTFPTPFPTDSTMLPPLSPGQTPVLTPENPEKEENDGVEEPETVVLEEETPEIYGETANEDVWNAWTRGGYPFDAVAAVEPVAMPLSLGAARAVDTDTEDSKQIVEPGGSNENQTDGVKVSKTIRDTGLENVFDITLRVETTADISATMKDPDVAVVLVMDISRTMKDAMGNTTRYQAAIEAAERFINQFAGSTGERSRLGYVAFNTDATVIFDMQPCCDEETVASLVDTMKRETFARIDPLGETSRERFTNMEGGLKRAKKMLEGCSNPNQFIVFLSDGFPTTYDETDYTGYYPYCSSGKPGSDGVFYDMVTGKYCDYGTSYSDRAAEKAQSTARSIKNAGVGIFTVGVAVKDQSVAGYVAQTEGKSHAVVQRDSEDYIINRDSKEDFEGWLEMGIGSGEGYYFSIEDIQGLLDAYQVIFEQIQAEASEASKAVWVTQDPIPTVGETQYVEFLGFFDQANALQPTQITDNNRAAFDGNSSTIRWDLKQSRSAVLQREGKDWYCYQLTYRVRLKNEEKGFVAQAVYNTNDTTSLTYRVVTEQDGQSVITGAKSLEFPIPAVKGFLAELSFRKQDQNGRVVTGAEFTLAHDGANCKTCRGDGSAVGLKDYEAVSDEEGLVKFEAIPSGHRYILTESGVPAGYARQEGESYAVAVEYGDLTLERVCDGKTELLDTEEKRVIVNTLQPILPQTGGVGALPFAGVGAALTLGGGVALTQKGKERRRRRPGAR